MWVKCSEIRTFAYDRKKWVEELVKKRTGNYGSAMHEYVFNNKAEDMFKVVIHGRDLEKIEKIKKLLAGLGKVERAGFEENERLRLRGKADGLIDGIPVEIKFFFPGKRKRWADQLQAAAYGLLYRRERAYLVYPREVKVIEVEKYEKVVKGIIQKILTVKEVIFGDCCSG